MIYLSATTMTTITIDGSLAKGTRTHFADAYEMYQYFKALYATSDIENKWYAEDEIVFGWMNEKQLTTMLEQIEKEDEDGPFTFEESKVFLDKVVSWN